ncbi:apolipoprotein L3-like, partial [Nannospalax galili]|uniref:apolipoprotein L3-like n=1 Tax=Nannospalax galili TaxID=1026970 RepID=UPI0004ED10DE
EEEAALHTALEKDVSHMAMNDKDNLHEETQVMNFLEAFPELKRKLEEHIEKLHSLADHMDEEHKNFTIANVVTDSTSATSGILGLLGLVLAPFTVGSSLVLSLAGLGLGAVTTATDFTSMVVEETRRRSDEDEARRLVSTARDITKEVSVFLFRVSGKAHRTSKDIIKTLKQLGQHVRAIKAARMIATGRVPAQQAGQIRRAFEGTAVSMTRGARVRGAVFGAAFLALDVYSIVKSSMHLCEGAKSGLAEVLRQVAQELNDKLEELVEFHKTVCSDSPQ